MPSHYKNLTLLLALILSIGFTGAAVIETPGSQGLAWEDSQVEDQLIGQCAEGETVDSLQINVNGNTVGLKDEGSQGTSDRNVSLSSQNLRSVFSSNDDLSWSNQYEVSIECSSGEDSSSDIDFATAKFNSLTADGGDNGIGFLGEIMKDEKGSLGERDSVKIEPEISTGAEYSSKTEDLTSSSFEYTGEKLGSSDEGYEFVQDYVTENSEKDVFKLYPMVDGYIAPGENSTASFDGAGMFSGLETELSFDPFVHVWSSEVVRDPGRRLTYDEVEDEEYFYELFMEYAPNDNFPGLEDDNFVLTVEEKGEEWDSSYDPKENYQNMNILEWSQPESDSANYRIEISNYGKLDDLESGEYQFVLKLRYDDEDFRIAELPVEKKKQFSGQILDAGGNGVETDMTLTQKNGDREYNLNIGSNGRFSKTVAPEPEEYDITAEFFKSGQNGRDGKISMTNVELDESDLGSGASAIGFDYWQDPNVEIEGLEPVNMMAVKFGYSMENVEDLRMAFDPAELDPRDIKVYECDEWNFAGTQCLSTWDKLGESDDESIGINYKRWEAIINGVTTYNIDETNDILMSSYVIGTSSDIQLQESITVESTELTYNEEIDISGVLVDESGNRVEDADVTLSFKNTDYSWNTTTDSTGSFSISEPVKAGPGNYVLEMNAVKPPYNSLSVSSDETVNVEYEKGIETDVASDQDISQGETTSVEFELTNTGQTSVENIDVGITGFEDQYVESVDAPESIESGNTRTVTVNLALPDDYCSSQCYPELTANVEAESGDETVEASALILTTLEPEQEEQQNSSQGSEPNEEQDDSETDSDQNQDNGFNETQPANSDNTTDNPITGAFSEAQRMTGNFVQSQSDLNIALGLIMIFTMILAAAVKKKKDQGDNGRRRRGGGSDRSRPNIAGGASSQGSRVQRPDVNSDKEEPEQVDEPETEEGDEDTESSEEEESEDESESSEGGSEDVPDNVCDVCGEEFENATGVKIHKQAMH